MPDVYQSRGERKTRCLSFFLRPLYRRRHGNQDGNKVFANYPPPSLFFETDDSATDTQRYIYITADTFPTAAAKCRMCTNREGGNKGIAHSLLRRRLFVPLFRFGNTDASKGGMTVRLVYCPSRLSYSITNKADAALSLLPATDTLASYMCIVENAVV
mmetsp:Transcript_25136/g.73714  ORF Transcript_25136/g.73714 Transcript_25136/m.73714 type:complete len:158 (-) Transcript_25136:61-534(-)